jgi:hypothetical protein
MGRRIDLRNGDKQMGRPKSSYNRPRGGRASIAIAFALVGFILIAGCSTAPKTEQSNANTATAEADKGGSISWGDDKGKVAKTQAKGFFKPMYAQVQDPERAKVRTSLQQDKVLEQICANLNQTVAIPNDITISITECGQPNAFYDPRQKQVSMCYELVEHFYNVFKPASENQEELDRSVQGAISFVFVHELGHALIDNLDLPVTGKEEDAVDQLATVVLVEGTENGEQSVLDGARSFYLQEQQGGADLNNLPFWDEHSLGPQRFYNLLCWLYGHNEQKYRRLVEQGILPEDRAVRCPNEYNQISRSWRKLMDPHLKKESQNP